MVVCKRVTESKKELARFPRGMTFFDPILAHEVKEAIESGGEVYVSEDQQGKKTGLFIYDEYEATGTVFTRTRDVFDHFYQMKPDSYIFSELDIAGLPHEVWNIWKLDVDKVAPGHRFRHMVSVEDDADEIERFMAATQPETNPRWVRIALKNGDKCFVVRMGGRIVGMAWMSISGSVARSHGLYVEPQFRRMGIMKDNLQARLIYLKSKHVHTLINEIVASNAPSAAHAESAGEEIVGKIYLYTSPEAPLAPDPSVHAHKSPDTAAKG